MTPAETLILALYFFVLVILAVYGWHRYYLVYLVHEAQGRAAGARRPVRRAAAGHDPAPALQRDVRRRSADRVGLPHRVSARAARDPGARRLDRRDARDCRARRAPLRRAGHRHQVHPPHRPHRLQGRRARRRHAGREGRVHRHLRRRLHPAAGLPDAHDPPLHQPARSRWCRRAGATSTRTTRC